MTQAHISRMSRIECRMTQQEHEAVLAEKLEAERKRILDIFQDEANYLMKKSFQDELAINRTADDFVRGLMSGCASAYELAAVWLQTRINRIKEEGLPVK